MALKTKPEQITAEDYRLVQQFIKESKEAGFDPTLTTIVLNKTRSDKSGKAAKAIANLQRKKPKVDPARAARSAEARRQAKKAGRESRAIKEEGGYLTQAEWLKAIAGTAAIASLPVLVAALGTGGVAAAAAPVVSAGAKMLAKGGAHLLKGAPKLLKGRRMLKGPKPKSLPAGRAPQPYSSSPASNPLKTSIGRPLGVPKQLADKTAWVARQEAAKKVMKDAAAKVVPKVKQMMGKGTPKAAPKPRGRPAFRPKAPVPASAAPAFGKEAAARMNREILAKVAKNPNAPALKDILRKGLDSNNLKEVHRFVTSPAKNANWSPNAARTPSASNFVKTMLKGAGDLPK